MYKTTNHILSGYACPSSLSSYTSSTHQQASGISGNIRITSDYIHVGPTGEKTGFKTGETYKLVSQTEEGFWVELKTKRFKVLSKTKNVFIPNKHGTVI